MVYKKKGRETMQFGNVHKHVKAGYLHINKTKIRYWIFKLGFLSLTTTFLFSVYQFVSAFCHPTNSVTLYIDVIGDKYFELLFICVFYPMATYAFFVVVRNVLPKIKEGLL